MTSTKNMSPSGNIFSPPMPQNLGRSWHKSWQTNLDTNNNFFGEGGGLVEIPQKTKYQKWIFYIYCQLLLVFDQLTQLTQLLFMRSKIAIKIWTIV